MSTLAPGGLLKGALPETEQKLNGIDFKISRPYLDPISSLGPCLPTAP